VLIRERFGNGRATSMATVGPSPKTSIDIIVYLASLASEQQAVSMIMDPMRRITATMRPGQAPTPDQEKVLQDVRERVERYLIEDDPFKALTPELIEDRVAHFCAAPEGIHVPWGILGLLAFAGLMSTALAVLPTNVQEFQRPTMAVVGLLSGLSLGASWMFFLALPSTRKTLRPALVTLSAGIAYDCLVQLQLPVLIATNNLGSTFAEYGLYLVFYMPVSLLYFLGLRQFARLLGVPNTWRRIRFVIAACAAFILLIAFVPHAPNTVPEWAFRLTMVTNSIQVGFLVLTAQLVLRIISRLTTAYATTMKYFLWALLCTLVSLLMYMASQVFIGGLQDQSQNNNLLITLTVIPSMAAELLLAWAGYSFRRASRR
jgi:hypothetical protein